MGKYIDLTGKVFERLKVIGFHSRSAGTTYWLCQCLCGVTKPISAPSLRSGNTKSCGCLRQEITRQTATKHGQTNSRAYAAWSNMLSRCENSNVPGYKNYGGRGLKVCKQWHKFAVFFADMGQCPPSYTLERKNNSKGYTLKNCVWAARKQQANNRREAADVLKASYKGRTLSIHEWSVITGIAPSVLWQRRRRGWDVKSMLTIPVGTIWHFAKPGI